MAEPLARHYAEKLVTLTLCDGAADQHEVALLRIGRHDVLTGLLSDLEKLRTQICAAIAHEIETAVRGAREGGKRMAEKATELERTRIADELAALGMEMEKAGEVGTYLVLDNLARSIRRDNGPWSNKP